MNISYVGEMLPLRIISSANEWAAYFGRSSAQTYIHLIELS